MKLRELALELDSAESRIRHQDQDLTRSRREYVEVDNKLRYVNDLYKKVNPRGQKTENQILDEEIKEARRLLKAK